ncbi:alpha/beta hydrolase [Luteolibacter yonseiensis]|uniref:Alpha/beta hydrolase n=2 Tax=Luteolibacter yonseiensis TaxID=1144680 RepID=A0A934V612_9BACT|nr:alpha/beta hydrolase [Luteolibacter yonseiensis]
MIGEFANAQRHIMSSMKVGTSRPLAALGGYLEAAEFSSRQLASNPGDEQARLDYNFATSRIISIIQKAKFDPWNKPLHVPTDNGGFTLTNRPGPNPRHHSALFDFTPADEFDIGGSYITKRSLRPGIGAPTVVVGKARREGAREDFAMDRVYYGVTTVVRFKGRNCEISFEDPLAVETTVMNGKTYPLAADFTVPLAVLLASNDPRKLEIMRVLRPGNYAETARITALQPYDPNKTVVLVIHGLMDSPATWTPMINTLRGNVEIRRNYQFWFYSYPSGYPYPYSASILRDDLDAVEKRYSLRKPMVVLGHSMGGCISRLLITDTEGDKLWRKTFGKPPEQVKLSAENKVLFEKALIFKHRPEIGRVIFIAAPLKGSDLSNNWVGRLGSRLVHAPTTFLKAGAEVAQLITFQPGDLRIKGLPNSVDTLSPTNRFVKTINTFPITPGVPYHTIMGDRGKGNAPKSSDGVVPYWSSHMDGAESELVVPSGHSAHQNPQAIDEVARILELNLR